MLRSYIFPKKMKGSAIITYVITCIDESKGLLDIISDSTVNYENMVRNKTNKYYFYFLLANEESITQVTHFY